MRVAVFSCAIVLAGWPVQAQSPRVEWTEPDVVSLTQALEDVYRIYIDNQPRVVLPNAVCEGSPPVVSCQAPLPAAAVLDGASYQLTATDPFTMLESAKSPPFVFHTEPPPPPPPTSGGGCTYQRVTYAVGEMVEDTTNEQRMGKVILQELEEAFFRIDSTEQVANNQYRITATCIGG